MSQRRLICSISELGRKRAQGCRTSTDISSPERVTAEALFGSQLPLVFITQEGKRVITRRVLTGEGQLKGLHVLKSQLVASGCGGNTHIV